jgi:hypothetical protein
MDTFIMKKSQNINLKRRKIVSKTNNYVYEKIKILLLSIIICIGSYFTGIIVYMMFKSKPFEILTRGINPIVFILLGIVVIIPISICIISFKRYYTIYQDLVVDT